MYYIDLSMRNPEQGYADSIALIAEVVGTPDLHLLAGEARGVMMANQEDAPELLDWIHNLAENIAYMHGYSAFTHEGFQYVMTDEESEEWWADR